MGWPSGLRLNKLAYESSYTERGLAVPAGGPRDGWWGRALGERARDPHVGWYEAKRSVPGKFQIDAEGLQHVRREGTQPRFRVLILGGSVAWGADASDQAHTYFSLLVDRLDALDRPVQLSVLAAAAWVAGLEVRALARRGLQPRPDLVVFLHGLNDLTRTQQRSVPYAQRPQKYMNAVVEARDMLRLLKIPVVFVLQPFLPDKTHRSRLEGRILQLAFKRPGSERALRAGYPLLRQGLADVARDPGVTFIDASGVFSAEGATTFIDLWHFTDPGHALLALFLAEKLASLVPAASSSRGR